MRDRCAFLAGVEPDPGLSGHARDGYDDWHQADAFSAGPWSQPFDAVVCADVLEHLARPEDLLARIHGWLRPGGTLLVSLPNVANVTVRAGLLLGRFPYAERGILDRTHLRFYTRRSARDLLTGAGFRVRERRGDRDALRARGARSSPRRRGGFRCAPSPAPRPASGRRCSDTSSSSRRRGLEGLGGAEAVTASLILPAYNESGRIEACLRGVAEWLRSSPGGVPWEIILVDDGSTDDTAARARALAAEQKLPLSVLTYGENRGKGAAIRTGVLASSGDSVLVSDVDLSTPLAEFEKLAGRLATHPIAIGSRALQEELVRKPQAFHRVLLGRAGNQLIQLLAIPGIRDTQCGFKLFRGDVARELFRDARIERFAWDVEILFLARKRGVAIAEVPVLWFNSPESKVRVVRDAIQTLWDVLRIRWIHRGAGPAASRGSGR